MAVASYRFFPWVRSGLVAGLPAAAPGGARATIGVKLTVTPEIATSRTVTLLGPGDVLGIDQRLIVRVDPRPGARQVEPNYLAAIEFDRPDFPWMLTPRGPDGDGRLPPWLVLVVLRCDRVAPPQVARNRPLPFVTFPDALAGEELPDLAESWAWAHAQRVASGEPDDAAALAAAPDRNVSRLLCPRRLTPNQRWMACLVPAFDVGVAAGLGLPPADPAAPPGPAWDAASTGLVLPLYHHWTFETGEDGDFEKLAGRLTPYKALPAADGVAPDVARRARAYLGGADGSGSLAEALPPGAPASAIRIEAPLEALDRPDAIAGEVAAALAAALAAATAPADPADPQADLLPPLSGARHAGRDSAAPAQIAERWFDELNLDPRTRVAARIGADTVRAHQEDLMQTAWEQVGDVLEANAQLDRSRFAAAVAASGFRRHLETLPPARLLAVTSAVHARARIGEVTGEMVIARTSLPDRAFDSALRRITGEAARPARAAARLVPASAARVLTLEIGAALQRDAATVEPSLRARDGIDGLAIGRLAIERGGPGATVPLPGGGTIAATMLARRIEDIDERLTPRPDLADHVLTDRNRSEILEVAARTGLPLAALTSKVRAAAARAPKGAILAVRDAGGAPAVDPVVCGSGGAVSLVESEGKRLLFTIDEGEAGDARSLAALAMAMPAEAAPATSLSAVIREREGVREISFARLELASGAGLTAAKRAAKRRAALRAARANRIFRQADRPADRGMFVATLSLPGSGAAVADKVRRALAGTIGDRPRAIEPAFVRADLSDAAGGLAARLRAAIAPHRTFRDRVRAMVSVPEWVGKRADVLHPISAAPDYGAALSALMAASAPEAFLPRDLALPAETIAALRTNPRWVAACMVGANHELNRELLWRTYPTDGRGTSLERFWDWFDPGRADVRAIHRWPAAGPIAMRLEGSDKASLVIAVRGTLLQRYPNTLLFLWKAAGEEKLAPIPADAAARPTAIQEAQFREFVAPDVTLAGFDLSPAEFRQGWFLVMQEPLSESRFGLDESGTAAGPGRNFNDLNWDKMAVAQGTHLTIAAIDAAIDGDADLSSARIANLLLQRPVRVAVHSSRLADALA